MTMPLQPAAIANLVVAGGSAPVPQARPNGAEADTQQGEK